MMHASRGLIGFLCLVLASAAAAEAPENDGPALRIEYGVSMALAGERDEARSAFLSVLSEEPTHAGALNNLGNLHLASGELSVALAFYDKAAGSDPGDAGILLNRSIALMLAGAGDEAQAEAARAVDMAGSADEARTLLGLERREARAQSERAADRAVLTQEEIQALLDAAAASVPSDTTAVAVGDSVRADSTDVQAGPGRPAVWRSAGLRADDLGDLVTSLYWSH